MQIPKQATLLRIFIGEDDRRGHEPLYQAIVLKAHEMHLAARDRAARADGLRPFEPAAHDENLAPFRRTCRSSSKSSTARNGSTIFCRSSTA